MNTTRRPGNVFWTPAPPSSDQEEELEDLEEEEYSEVHYSGEEEEQVHDHSGVHHSREEEEPDEQEEEQGHVYSGVHHGRGLECTLELTLDQLRLREEELGLVSENDSFSPLPTEGDGEILDLDHSPEMVDSEQDPTDKEEDCHTPTTSLSEDLTSHSLQVAYEKSPNPYSPDTHPSRAPGLPLLTLLDEQTSNLDIAHEILPEIDWSQTSSSESENPQTETVALKEQGAVSKIPVKLSVALERKREAELSSARQPKPRLGPPKSSCQTRAGPERDGRAQRGKSALLSSGVPSALRPDLSKVQPRVHFPKDGYTPPSPRCSLSRSSLSPQRPLVYMSPADIMTEVLLSPAQGAEPEEWQEVEEGTRAALYIIPPDFRSKHQAIALFNQLQEENSRLKLKYAEATNTIDRLRLEGKVNLYSDPPKPGLLLHSGLSAQASQPLTLHMPCPQRPEVHPTRSSSSVQTGDQHRRPGSSASASEGSSSDTFGRLYQQALLFMKNVETFEGRLQTEGQTEKQMEAFRKLLWRLDCMEKAYMLAKKEHQRLQTDGAQIGSFDPQRELEGLIFQCGQQMDELKERVQKGQSHRPSPPFHQTPPTHQATPPRPTQTLPTEIQAAQELSQPRSTPSSTSSVRSCSNAEERLYHQAQAFLHQVVSSEEKLRAGELHVEDQIMQDLLQRMDRLERKYQAAERAHEQGCRRHEETGSHEPDHRQTKKRGSFDPQRELHRLLLHIAQQINQLQEHIVQCSATPTYKATPTYQVMPTHQAIPTYEVMNILHGADTHQASPTHQTTSTHHATDTNVVTPTHQFTSTHQATPTHQVTPSFQAMPTHQVTPTYQAMPTHQVMPGYQVTPTYQATPTHQVTPAHQSKPTHQIAAIHQTTPTHQAMPNHQATSTMPNHHATASYQAMPTSLAMPRLPLFTQPQCSVRSGGQNRQCPSSSAVLGQPSPRVLKSLASEMTLTQNPLPAPRRAGRDQPDSSALYHSFTVLPMPLVRELSCHFPWEPEGRECEGFEEGRRLAMATELTPYRDLHRDTAYSTPPSARSDLSKSPPSTSTPHLSHLLNPETCDPQRQSHAPINNDSNMGPSRGGSEVGHLPSRGKSEMRPTTRRRGSDWGYVPSRGGSELGQLSSSGGSEVRQLTSSGSSEVQQVPSSGGSEVGPLPSKGSSEGRRLRSRRGSEVGRSTNRGGSEVGRSASRGGSEVGQSASSSLSSLREASDRTDSKVTRRNQRGSQDGLISPELDSGFVGSPAAVVSPVHQKEPPSALAVPLVDSALEASMSREGLVVRPKPSRRSLTAAKRCPSPASCSQLQRSSHTHRTEQESSQSCCTSEEDHSDRSSGSSLSLRGPPSSRHGDPLKAPEVRQNAAFHQLQTEVVRLRDSVGRGERDRDDQSLPRTSSPISRSDRRKTPHRDRRDRGRTEDETFVKSHIEHKRAVSSKVSQTDSRFPERMSRLTQTRDDPCPLTHTDHTPQHTLCQRCRLCGAVHTGRESHSPRVCATVLSSERADPCVHVCPRLLLYSPPSPVLPPPSKSETPPRLRLRLHRPREGRSGRRVPTDGHFSLDEPLSRALRAARSMKHTSRHMVQTLASGLQHQSTLACTH